MAYICERCGKGMVHGSTQRHGRGVAGKRWKKRAQETKRTFLPNLQNYKGQKLCASCIKKIKSQKTSLA